MEAKEKMQRQSASLQKQLKGVRELVKGNDESLVGERWGWKGSACMTEVEQVQIQEQKEKLREKVVEMKHLCSTCCGGGEGDGLTCHGGQVKDSIASLKEALSESEERTRKEVRQRTGAEIGSG